MAQYDPEEMKKMKFYLKRSTGSRGGAGSGEKVTSASSPSTLQ